MARSSSSLSRTRSMGYVCSSCAAQLRSGTPRRPPQMRTLATQAQTSTPALKTAPHPLAPYPNAFAYRWDTFPPTISQLSYADKFFLHSRPQLLWSAAHFRTTPQAREPDGSLSVGLPEVAFLGRSNVGKSSLLNALLGRRGMVYTSSKPGKTRTMNAFQVGGKGNRKLRGRGLVVLDMPGYGKASREEWGREIMKYLVGRRESVAPTLYTPNSLGRRSMKAG